MLVFKVLGVFAGAEQKSHAVHTTAWLYAVFCLRYIMNFSRKFLTSFDIAKSMRSIRSVMPTTCA